MYLEYFINPDDKAYGAMSNIVEDQQSAQVVKKIFDDPDCVEVTKWVLFDNKGVRCIWERKENACMPIITLQTPRFSNR